MRAHQLLGLAVGFSALNAMAGEPGPMRTDSALSRVTIGLPVATHHFPRNSEFNNQNWGVLIDVSLAEEWSTVGGYFRNSYDRDTVFAGAGWYPIKFEVAKVHLDLGALAGLDLSGGYKGYNRAYPLLGALSMKIRKGATNDTDPDALDRIGLALTLIPAVSGRGSTAVSLALTYRL
jgi:hypothetical protein